MQNSIKFNKRFQIYEISAQRIYQDKNQDGLQEHNKSLTHIDNLTNKILTIKQANQSFFKEESLQESEIFNYKKAEAKLKNSLKDLKRYFEQCIINHPEILKGLTPKSAQIYVNALKNFYLYLFEKKQNSNINSETIVEYLESNITNQSVIKRLFKAFNIPLKYSVKQRLSKYYAEGGAKKMPYNYFEELQNKLIQQLQDRKYYKEALAILLSKQGMPPHKVRKIQVKNIPKDNNETIHLIQKIFQDNPESYLFDNKISLELQSRQFLDFRKKFQMSYHQDQEFQHFIMNSSLRFIYEMNKKLKYLKQNQKERKNGSQTQDQSNHKEGSSLLNEPMVILKSQQVSKQHQRKVKIIQTKKIVQIEVNQRDQTVMSYDNYNKKQ